MNPEKSPDIPPFDAIARRTRARLIRMSHDAGAAHLGSAMSCVDILVAAYFGVLRIDPSQPDDPNRDRFILSKGHAASALYAVLAERGFFPHAWLDTFGKHGSRLAEQPAPRCAPGVEAATGSLGHGLPLGVGMALAARIQKRDYRVVVVMSDGECNEGSVWESAMFAPAQGLSNLCVIIDYNKWQATGRSNEIMSLAPLAEKWEAFGWRTIEVDGHDINKLIAAMTNFQSVSQHATRSPQPGTFPTAIIAHTTKGKGVSFMEDDNNWHYRIPNERELADALTELAAP
ncbi:MAG: transketolase [Phycisphaeraceae bacterium]